MFFLRFRPVWLRPVALYERQAVLVKLQRANEKSTSTHCEKCPASRNDFFDPISNIFQRGLLKRSTHDLRCVAFRLMAWPFAGQFVRSCWTLTWGDVMPCDSPFRYTLIQDSSSHHGPCNSAPSCVTWFVKVPLRHSLLRALPFASLLAAVLWKWKSPWSLVCFLPWQSFTELHSRPDLLVCATCISRSLMPKPPPRNATSWRSLKQSSEVVTTLSFSTSPPWRHETKVMTNTYKQYMIWVAENENMLPNVQWDKWQVWLVSIFGWGLAAEGWKSLWPQSSFVQWYPKSLEA